MNESERSDAQALKCMKTKWGALAASFLMACLCAVAAYKSLGFVYNIADDVIMRDIASGAFTGTPDGHLFFVKYVLGWLISKFYIMSPNVDWYGFIIAGAPFLGLAAVLYRGLSMSKSGAWKFVYCAIAVGIFCTAVMPRVALFEFTMSAAVVGSSALFLYVSIGDGPQDRRIDKTLICVLLILTFCIRAEVFFMVMPGFGIAFLCKFIKKNERGLLFKWRALLLPAVVFLTLGLVEIVEASAYSDYEWTVFSRFQVARSDVYDYYGVPSYEANPELFEELGLSEHDVRNLRHYALYIVDGMDADMMEALSAESKRQYGADMILTHLKDGIKLAKQRILFAEYMPISLPALAFMLLSLIMIIVWRRRLIVPLAAFLISQLVLWLILGYMGRIPTRVAVSLHMVTLYAMVGLFLYLWNCMGKRRMDLYT